MKDLFGFDTDAEPARGGETSLAMVLHDERPAAWRLGQTEDAAAAKWVPKSQVSRGEGRDENVWTMPVWLARDRGWL